MATTTTPNIKLKKNDDLDSWGSNGRDNLDLLDGLFKDLDYTDANIPATQLIITANTTDFGLKVANAGTGVEISAPAIEVNILKSDVTNDITINSNTDNIVLTDGTNAMATWSVVAGTSTLTGGQTTMELAATNINLNGSSSTTIQSDLDVDNLISDSGSPLHIKPDTAGIKLTPAVSTEVGLNATLTRSAAQSLLLTVNGTTEFALRSLGLTKIQSNSAISLFPDFDGTPANELKLSSVSTTLTLETAQTLNFKTSVLNIQSDTGVSIFPKFGTDPVLKLTIQNNSGDLELSSGTDNLIITSSEAITINADTGITIIPDKDGNPTKTLQINYNPVGAGIEFISADNLLLNAAAGGQITLAIAAATKAFLNASKLNMNVPLRFSVLASDPSSPETGWTYYNTGTNKLKFFNGTIWETITSA